MTLHPNTKRFLAIMDTINFKKWNHFHPTEDFGNAVRRMSEEDGNDEDYDDPSDEAIVIALKLAKKYGGTWP